METTQRNSGRKLNLYNVTLVICIVMIIIFLIIIIPFSKDKDSQNNKIQIVESSVKSGEEITEEEAISLAISQFDKIGEHSLKKENITISKIERKGEYYYYICSPENTLEIQISGGKITRLNSVPVENL